MDSTAIIELIDQLDDDVDDLEESLAPLLKTALSESASKLPLLDKAKSYILVTYAIESILFGLSQTYLSALSHTNYHPAYLRINGVKARDHPVFKELTRVKQYFDKIKAAEEPPAERTTTLDKGAAARFIKAGLVSLVSVFIGKRETDRMVVSLVMIDSMRKEQRRRQRRERSHISSSSNWKHRRRKGRQRRRRQSWQ